MSSALPYPAVVSTPGDLSDIPAVRTFRERVASSRVVTTTTRQPQPVVAKASRLHLVRQPVIAFMTTKVYLGILLATAVLPVAGALAIGAQASSLEAQAMIAQRQIDTLGLRSDGLQTRIDEAQSLTALKGHAANLGMVPVEQPGFVGPLQGDTSRVDVPPTLAQ